MRKISMFLFFFLPSSWACGQIVVDASDGDFQKRVLQELRAMREGQRGVASAELVRRLDAAGATLTITPLTADDETWHPNDRRGTRSHVVAKDTLIRGAERTSPTDAVLYLHPHRVDPRLSVYRLGTFVEQLAVGADLLRGAFPGDFQLRERRTAFFRNAWRDALGHAVTDMVSGVETLDYQEAKEAGLLAAEFAEQFPILDLPTPETQPALPVRIVDFSRERRLVLDPLQLRAGDAWVGRFGTERAFVSVTDEAEEMLSIRFGWTGDGTYALYAGRWARADDPVAIPVTRHGPDFSLLLDRFSLVSQGFLDGETEDWLERQLHPSSPE